MNTVEDIQVMSELHRETMNLLAEVIADPAINSVEHKITFLGDDLEKQMAVGAIHICLQGEVNVRIRRVLMRNQDPKTVAQEIHDEIVRRIGKQKQYKLLHPFY